MSHGQHRNRKWGAVLLLAAAMGLIGVYVLPALANSDDSPDCKQVRQQEKMIASGLNPGGNTWKVEASIRGDCNYSLVGWRFMPSGGPRGSWSGKWSIPTGGHLPESATIAARDEASDSARAFSGVVGGDVTRVTVSTESGKTVFIHPKLPAKSLLQKFPWLRQTRYFIRFYPSGDHVKSVELLKRDGDIKYSARAAEGGVEGPMSVR